MNDSSSNNNKVYLYSRVSTSDQTCEQQERTAYEWLRAHGMKVDKVVSDEGVSGGVTYKERNLGKLLLPQLMAGDVLIVSEISRLGRSMFDLSTLIHTELKPRKVRLVIVSMGIDLRCDHMTAIDELILNNFSFAAQLEKQLISERTTSALLVRKQQGVKLGGASEKWRKSYKAKSIETKGEEEMRRGVTKTRRHLESREVQAFACILRSVFPQACVSDDMTTWSWSMIDTRYDNRMRVLRMMRDYKTMDTTKRLFLKWDLDEDNIESRALQQKLSGYIKALEKSVLKSIEHEAYEKRHRRRSVTTR